MKVEGIGVVVRRRFGVTGFEQGLFTHRECTCKGLNLLSCTLTEPCAVALLCGAPQGLVVSAEGCDLVLQTGSEGGLGGELLQRQPLLGHGCNALELSPCAPHVTVPLVKQVVQIINLHALGALFRMSVACQLRVRCVSVFATQHNMPCHS